MNKIQVKYKQGIDVMGGSVKNHIQTAIDEKRIIDAESIIKIVEDFWEADDLAGVMQNHIYAALRRNDFLIQDGEKFTQDVIMRELSRKSGYDLRDGLDVDSVVKALDKPVTAFINQSLSTNIASVIDQVEFREGLTQVIVAQVENGGIGKVVADSKANILKIGNIATSAAFLRLQAKSIRDGHKKLMRRIYQKRYERTHKKVWI